LKRQIWPPGLLPLPRLYESSILISSSPLLLIKWADVVFFFFFSSSLFHHTCIRAFSDTEQAALFSQFDQDASGYIEVDELSQMLKNLRIELNEENTYLLLRRIDQNSDGKLTFTEFRFRFIHPFLHYRRRSLAYLLHLAASLLALAENFLKS
jgi:hypothetical protein